MVQVIQTKYSKTDIELFLKENRIQSLPIPKDRASFVDGFYVNSNIYKKDALEEVVIAALISNLGLTSESAIQNVRKLALRHKIQGYNIILSFYKEFLRIYCSNPTWFDMMPDEDKIKYIELKKTFREASDKSKIEIEKLYKTYIKNKQEEMVKVDKISKTISALRSKYDVNYRVRIDNADLIRRYRLLKEEQVTLTKHLGSSNELVLTLNESIKEVQSQLREAGADDEFVLFREQENISPTFSGGSSES